MDSLSSRGTRNNSLVTDSSRSTTPITSHVLPPIHTESSSLAIDTNSVNDKSKKLQEMAVCLNRKIEETFGDVAKVEVASAKQIVGDDDLLEFITADMADSFANIEEVKEDFTTTVSFEGKFISLPNVCSYISDIGKGLILTFNWNNYHDHFKALCRHTRCTTTCFGQEVTLHPNIERDFLCLGFHAARVDLIIAATRKLKNADNHFMVALAADALNIAQEEYEWLTPNFDTDAMLERIERMGRVAHALQHLGEEGLDSENNLALGFLAERSGSKSYWWFFLGVVILAASAALVMATHGVAIPYLKPLIVGALETNQATALASLGGVGGLGLIFRQQQSYSTKLCCFWHRFQHADQKAPQVSTSSRLGSRASCSVASE